MSAGLPLECLSPTERDKEQAQDNDSRFQSFKSFINPALGVSVSSSIGQLKTPVTVDPGQQAQFFTPFSNKAFDSSVLTESDAFFSALGTSLRSTQSVRSDANAGMRGSRPHVHIYAFGDGGDDTDVQALGSTVGMLALARAAAAEHKPLDSVAEDAQPASPVSPREALVVGTMPCEAQPVFDELNDAIGSKHGLTLEIDTGQPASSAISTSSVSEAADAPAVSPPAVTPRSVHSQANDEPPSPDASVIPNLETTPCQLAVMASPSPSDGSVSQLPLPTDEELDISLEEGSGETSGSMQQPTVYSSKKPPVRPVAQRPASARRDASEHAPTKSVRATSVNTAAVRKAPPSARHQPGEAHGTPMSISRPVSVAKQSSQRPSKGDDVVQTTQKSAPRQRKHSTLADEHPVAATPRSVALASPIRRASNAGAAAQAAAGGAGTATATGAGDQVGGTGTPFFLKRIRNAAEKSPIAPFANLKAQPTSRGTGCLTDLASVQPGGIAVGTAVASQPAENMPPPKQPTKKAAKGKAPGAAAAHVAGTKGADAKAGLARKASGSEPGARTGAGSDVPAARRETTGGGAAQKAAGKAAVPHGSVAPSKPLPASNRATAKQGTAAVTKGVEAKQAKAKISGGGASGAAACCDLGPEAIAPATRMILTRKPSGDGVNGEGVAACRYGRARTAAPDPATAAPTVAAGSRSPEKLPPSKRQAKPITSPSKRPRQEQAGGAVPGSSTVAALVPTGRTAAAPLPINTKVAASTMPSRSPGRLSPLLVRGAKPSPATTRKPRPSAAASIPETSPMQITPHTSNRKAPKSAARSPSNPCSVPKLNVAGLAACKSPLATPRAMVAADMVPLRQQPVSTRSPAVGGVGGLLSAPRTSPSPMTSASPAAGVAKRSSLAGSKPQSTTPPIDLPDGEPPQPMSWSKGVHSKPAARNEPETMTTGQQQQPPTAVALRERKTSVPGAPAAAHAPTRTSKPPGKPAAPAPPTAARAESAAADPGRPLTTRHTLGGGAPKSQVPAKGAISHRGPITHRPAPGAAAAAPSGTAPKSQTAAAPASKPDKVTAAVPRARAPSAAPARESTGGSSAGTSGKADEVELQAPAAPVGAGAGEEKVACNPVSRAPNAGAALPPARGKRAEPEEGVDRRKQYEVLLGRTVPHAPHPEPVAFAAAAPPAGKPAAKGPAARPAPAQASSPLQAARGPLHKVAAPAGENQADGKILRQKVNDQARGAAPPQRARATRAAAGRHFMSPPEIVEDTFAASEGGAGAAGLPAEQAAEAASKECEQGTVRLFDVPGRAPTPRDLSWLVDASPCGSLAVTPGALVAIAASPLGNAFGFGDAPEEGAAVCEPVSSFGFDEPQPAAAGEADRAAVLPFFSPLPRANSGTDALGRPPIMPVPFPQGLPPTGLGPAGLAGADVPGSTFTTKAMMHALTPGPAFQFAKPVVAGGAAGGRPKPNAGPTPVLFPQAKLRFSWDPSASPPLVGAQQQQAPAVAAFCPTPGMAVSGIENFSNPAPLADATPMGPVVAGGGAYMAAALPGNFGSGVLGDSADRDLPAELPVPVQCTSPNTSPLDPFAEGQSGGVHARAGVAGQGVVVFGGGGMGRAGRVVEDSFDALRISSMSYWPLVRDREQEDVRGF